MERRLQNGSLEAPMRVSYQNNFDLPSKLDSLYLQRSGTEWIESVWNEESQKGNRGGADPIPFPFQACRASLCESTRMETPKAITHFCPGRYGDIPFDYDRGRTRVIDLMRGNYHKTRIIVVSSLLLLIDRSIDKSIVSWFRHSFIIDVFHCRLLPQWRMWPMRTTIPSMQPFPSLLTSWLMETKANLGIIIMPLLSVRIMCPGNNSYLPVISNCSVFRFKEAMDIQWIAGAPPKDEPECGFHGELCKDSLTSCKISLFIFSIFFVYIRSV